MGFSERTLAVRQFELVICLLDCSLIFLPQELDLGADFLAQRKDLFKISLRPFAGIQQRPASLKAGLNFPQQGAQPPTFHWQRERLDPLPFEFTEVLARGVEVKQQLLPLDRADKIAKDQHPGEYITFNPVEDFFV